MLDFELSEEQRILQAQVRHFAEKEIAPIAGELDEKEEFPLGLVRKIGDLGLFGMLVPEEYGGSAAGYLSYLVAVEEIARVDGSSAATVAAGNSLGIGPILYYGSEEQKRQWLPPLCRGEVLASFGLTESDAGSDAGAVRTTAVLDGEDWVINGSKIFITNSASPISGLCIVHAVTGRRPDGHPETSCILVPNGTPGFTHKAMHRKMMWRSSNTGELHFDDCRVPRENLLGRRGEGFRQMLSTLDRGRLSIAAMGVGGAQGAFELALKYAGERRQFGKPVGNFQVNSFKLADAAVKIESARLLLHKAAWLCENGRPFTQYAAMSKLFASTVFRDVVYDCVQIHGGYGLMKEFPIERFYRDQRVLEIGEGTSEIQRQVIARMLGLDPVF